MVGIQLTVPTNFIHARVSCARPSACTARRIRSGRRSMGSPGSFGCCCPSGHKHLSPASSARGSWASTAAAPPPMLISVAKWGISLGTDAVSTCQARNHIHELSPINPTTATSTSLQRQRDDLQALHYLVAGLGDEDLVLDADAHAAVPLRRALLQYRGRWDINPGLDRDDLRTRKGHQRRWRGQ
jgi:hypothetical protein